MPRNYKVYLEDILDSIKAVEEFTAGISCQEFCGDRKTFDAVARNLEIIGEASKKLPEDVRALFPAVQWKKIETETGSETGSEKRKTGSKRGQD